MPATELAPGLRQLRERRPDVHAAAVELVDRLLCGRCGHSRAAGNCTCRPSPPAAAVAAAGVLTGRAA